MSAYTTPISVEEHLRTSYKPPCDYIDGVLRGTKYLVPDIAVRRVSELHQPYPAKPIHLCIELLSPDDRFSEVIASARTITLGE